MPQANCSVSRSWSRQKISECLTSVRNVRSRWVGLLPSLTYPNRRQLYRSSLGARFLSLTIRFREQRENLRRLAEDIGRDLALAW